MKAFLDENVHEVCIDGRPVALGLFPTTSERRLREEAIILCLYSRPDRLKSDGIGWNRISLNPKE